MHPSKLIFFLTLALSVLAAISVESWMFAWMMLEVNLLSFVPLLLLPSTKLASDSSLKYFLIQALGSIFLLFFLLMSYLMDFLFLVLFLPLALKMGVAPFHQWVPSMIEGVSWPVCFILLSFQKMALLSLFFSLTCYLSSSLVCLLVISSAVVGSIGGLSQHSVRKIFVFSSIAHMAWLLAATLLISSTWMTYFFFYALILATSLAPFAFTQASSLSDLLTVNKLVLSILYAVPLMSLGGLPPFSGFFPKLLLIQTSLVEKYPLLVAVLLAATLLTLFFYARLFMTMFMITSDLLPTKWRHFSVSKLCFFNFISLLAPSILFLY